MQNDAGFSGTFVEEGARVAGTILAGESHGGVIVCLDSGKKTTVKSITGKITFVADGNNLRVELVHFDHKLGSADVVQKGYVFKKQE